MKTARAGVTAVAMGGRAVLIVGPAGSGKSTLALELIDRGAQLIGDDGVTLERRGDTLWALPPPNTAGLIELRNVGLIELPTSAAPAALVIELTKRAARLPEGPLTWESCDISVPLVQIDPSIPARALRVEHALRVYGTP